MINRLRQLIFILILGIVLVIILTPQYKQYFYEFVHKLLWYSHCDRTITYSITYVDPKFNISEQKVQDNIRQAANMWNETLKKQVFVESSKGDIEIKLVYDERQRLLTEISTDETDVESEKRSIQNYLSTYEKQLSDLREKIEDLNDRIGYWNSRGGAPEDEYEKLKEEQERLSGEIDRVNRERDHLLPRINDLNQKISEFNDTVGTFNNLLGEKPEEGLFIGSENRIEIYFYDTEKKFIHTAAHEFGHSLGMLHTGNPKSIMHPVTSDVTSFSKEDLDLITSHCEEKNRLETLFAMLLNSKRIFASE